MIKYIFFAAAILISACNNNNSNPGQSSTPAAPSGPPVIGYSVLNVFPHDDQAFTQGLVIKDGIMYEGTGQKGASSLRKVDITTGEVKQKVDLDPKLFGEGITVFDNKIYQLTWEENVVLVYDLSTLRLLKSLHWPHAGWGLTNTDSSLIISDGSDKLYFADPGNLQISHTISVQNHLGPVNNINELELIDGYIYANQWESDHILKINPASGKVEATIDLRDILKRYANVTLSRDVIRSGGVLNGIAWDEQNQKMYVTGKYWPNLFEIKLN